VTQKKNFGLAAQLTQPRPTPPPPSPVSDAVDAATDDDAPASATGSASDIELTSPVFDDAATSRTERSDHTDHTKRGRRKEKKPGAPPREGGYVRRTITLAPTLSDYVDRAWRTYRRPDGKYVKGVSGFIEAVIDEHRRRGH
jgi:hypothetical protein